MGLKCSPDIAQAAMESVLSDIEDADVYINDVGAFSNDWDHHVNLLATILRQLRDNGFTIHLLCVGWRNLFPSCAVVSVFGSGGE
jgi:hypothetical protein